MKPRPWMFVAAAFVLVVPTWLAVAGAPARPSHAAASAVAKERGAVAKTDVFASKKRPVVLGKTSVAADPARRAEIAREMAERWRAFEKNRASGTRPSSARRAAYDALRAKCGAALEIRWDEESRLPIFASGTEAASVAERDPRQSAARFLSENADLLGLDDPDHEFSLTHAVIDEAGRTHLRYQQMYRGLEVWGRDLVVHVGADGRVTGFNGRYAATPRSIGVPHATVTPDEARDAAARAFGVASLPAGADPRLVVAPDGSGVLRLAWLVPADLALDRRWEVFVDAESGEVIHRVSRVATDGPVTGSGADLSNVTRTLHVYQVGSSYYMIDASKQMWDGAHSTPPQNVTGAIRVLDAQHGDGSNLYFISSNSSSSWSSFKNGVSASYFIGKVYDYYVARHGRNSIDGAGGTIESIVNLSQNYNNAFWNGTFMAFGNGDGSTFSDLAGAIDVAGHELTHGVVEHTANLVYENQSGALNESMADVFGTAIEFYVKGASANWLIGEDVTTPSIPNDCLRNMENPAAANVAFGGQQPTKMSEYQNLSTDQDNGGVHINSGIPNHAAYLIGSQISVDKMERIYYKALSERLTRSAQFIDARLAVVQAATELYGGSSNEADVCRSAFTAVEINDGSGTEPPEDEPPVDGQEWFAMTGTADGRVYRTQDFQTFVPVTTISVFNKPTYTDDGQTMLFVDSNHDVWAANSDGSAATPISSGGGWWSLAISPDGTRLALTTDIADSSIYVYNFGSQNMTRYYLACVTQDDPTPTYPDYADFLDFSLDDQYVLFDAYYSTGLGGSGIETWNINVLRLADGVAFRVFGTQPAGVNIGNPVFASNNDSRMALDYMDTDGSVTILGANLETGAVATISENGTALGRPDFSPDDRSVVYQYENPSTHLQTIWLVSLQPDGITGSGDDTPRAQAAYDPVWYAVGSRTAVDLAYFEAEQRGASCEVRWGAYSEANHAGYNLYALDGNVKRLLARGLTDPVSRGAVIAYRYADLVRSAGPARYLLEAVDREGRVQTFGPITARLVTSPVAAALTAAPNPFSAATLFTVAGEGQATLRLFDARGRLVRELLRDARLEGNRAVAWDGTDGAGRRMPSGVYFARLETPSGVRVERVVRLP
jgi:bacillolysin